MNRSKIGNRFVTFLGNFSSTLDVVVFCKYLLTGCNVVILLRYILIYFGPLQSFLMLFMNVFDAGKMNGRADFREPNAEVPRPIPRNYQLNYL